MNTIKRIFILLAAIICLAGCTDYKKFEDIKLLSYKVESFTPSGLKGVNADLALELDNPATSFSISDVYGVLYYKNKPYIYFTADPVEVQAKSVSTYPVHCTATLMDNVSLFELLSLTKNIEAGEITADVKAVAKLKNGIRKTFEYKKLQVKDLL